VERILPSWQIWNLSADNASESKERSNDELHFGRMSLRKGFWWISETLKRDRVRLERYVKLDFVDLKKL
jgi:hypothetical protein